MALKRINKVRVLDRTPVPRGKCAFSSVENFSPSAASEKVVFAQPVVCVNVLSANRPASQPAAHRHRLDDGWPIWPATRSPITAINE